MGDDRIRGNQPAWVRVQAIMTEYTDLELTEMHAEGVPCPDDDHAREYYELLDRLDAQLGALRDL